MSSGLLSAPSAVHLESSSSSTSAVIPAASPEPECTMLENECFCWYFAIGSMINHVSLKLRDIHPVKSFPAKLSGWRISFDGPGGMANVFEDSTNSFHGVLHLLSRHDMTELDKIEVNYYRVPVTAQLYDGTRQRCFVYKMDEAKLDRKIPSSLPSERYLDIIARGCEHYGVEKSYVDWLKCHPCSPRKKAEDFRAATVPEDAWNHIYTLEELKKCDGKDGRSACFAICGKVYKWNFTTEDTDKLDSLLSPMQKMWYNWHSTNSLGREISLRISHFLYEPRYPIAKTFEDMTTEQKLWVEDINYERMQAKATDGRSCWKIEGVMDYLIQKKEGTKIANTENTHNTTHNNLQTPLTSFDKAPPSPLTPPVNTSASN